MSRLKMKCGKPVTHESIWGMTRHYACEEHTRKLQALGNALGWPTNPVPVFLSDKLCENEVNKED